jgi:HPr kinase/phosphorylase
VTGTPQGDPGDDRPDAGLDLHASCVADAAGRALLILGPSGSGKSALAWALIGLGARLVADDRTELRRRGDRLLARPPAALAGLIEARGIGLLRAAALPEAEVRLAVDLGAPRADRLPPHRRKVILGVAVDLVEGPAAAHFPAALLHYLRAGRHA